MTLEKIVLLAKPSGITSFSSIASVKNAFCGQGEEVSLRAKASSLKVGHTGTLDSFADGLLVVLTGKLTRLAPFIETLPKEYRAQISFGIQTDTLDPSGAVVQKARLPTAGEVLSVLPNFIGKIMQRPPEYSALKQGGKRLSDLVREGKKVSPKTREVTVYQIVPELFISLDDDEASPKEFPIDSPVAKAVVRVSCSKGTYIRALARDIAEAAGSAAFLSFLRRLSVGPFLVENAAGFSALKPFAERHDDLEKPPLPLPEEILSKSLAFSPEIAAACGFAVLSLKKSALDDFRRGKAISAQWFDAPQTEASRSPLAVFCGDLFAGVIHAGHAENGKFFYDFVL